MQNQASALLPDYLRIFVIGEPEIFRRGLCLLLSQQPDFRVVGDTVAGKDAIALVQREKPDIVLLTVDGGGSASVGLLPKLFAVSEETKVLVLSEPGEKELQHQAIRLGAAGVIDKNKPAKMLVKAIERVNEGEAWLDRSTTASLLRELSPVNGKAKTDPEERKIASLSKRERQVIQMVGKGLKNKLIAETLFISSVTVHHHLTSIYAKLEVADRLELIIYSYRNGLADLPC
jgi:two-component system, NarL family, nitrate/nitrite response regulator NarL